MSIDETMAKLAAELDGALEAQRQGVSELRTRIKELREPQAGSLSFYDEDLELYQRAEAGETIRGHVIA